MEGNRILLPCFSVCNDLTEKQRRDDENEAKEDIDKKMSKLE